MISPGHKIDAKKILIAAGMEKTGMKTGMLTNYAFFSFKVDILKLKTRVSLEFGIKKAAPFQWEVLARFMWSTSPGPVWCMVWRALC